MLNNLSCRKKYSNVYGRKGITMEQTIEQTETMAEIWHLKKKLNKIYDENNQICSKMLEISEQLDKEIIHYLKINRMSRV